jgi:hypothetical protein
MLVGSRRAQRQLAEHRKIGIREFQQANVRQHAE